MDRSTLKIFVRAKGRLADSSIKVSKDLHELTLFDPLNKDPEQNFDYFRVFIESLQEEVFEISTRPLVEHVLDGFDGCVLIYGPSHTGKTYTMTGRELDHGLFYRALSAVLEESEKVITQKDVTVLVSVLELFGNYIRDLGLAYKDPHAINIFPTQQLELSELNGRVSVPNAWEFALKSVDEAMSLMQSVDDMRAALEAKQGKYSDKTHVIITIKVKQKFKSASWDSVTESVLFFVELPGSEKPRLRKGQEFYESLNATSSFHALSKCLSALNSVTIRFSEHKLTRIIENALKNNSMISLIGTVNIEKEFNEETARTLGFLDKCKAANIQTQLGESSNMDLTIKLLQDERVMLKDKLKKLEITQEEQLRKIVEALGVETDIDSLLQAQSGSKELQKLAMQRDAVNKVDLLARKNREIEKRVEENKKLFEKLKKIDFQSQEKHLRQVLEIKDELNRLKDLLEEAKATHSHNTRSQVETKTFELNEMLLNSQKLLEEKQKIMEKLPKSITATVSLPNMQDVKDFGKQEIIKEYNRKLLDQEKNNIKHFTSINKKFEMQLEQREKGLEEIHRNFENNKRSAENELESLKNEAQQLYDIAKAQRRIIVGIENGDYNQRMLKVEYPDDLIPEFPSEKEFPM
jgi:hypothetical protein